MPKSSIRNTYETNRILPSSRANNLFRCNTYANIPQMLHPKDLRERLTRLDATLTKKPGGRLKCTKLMARMLNGPGKNDDVGVRLSGPDHTWHVPSCGR
jgi:hypothetical protein